MILRIRATSHHIAIIYFIEYKECPIHFKMILDYEKYGISMKKVKTLIYLMVLQNLDTESKGTITLVRVPY